jgi:hypothetical protein
MPRAEAFASGPSSPVQKYLSWSSTEKAFHYYDKEQGKEVYIATPMSFIFLDAKATIKGWHSASDSRIYSNDVSNTKNEKFVVRAFKANAPLIEGFYQAIKGNLELIGGVYHVSLYAFSDKLGIVNIAMKGAALKEWSDFATANRKSFLNSYISVSDTIDKKTGAVKFSVPVFTVGAGITPDKSEESDKAYDELMAYFKSRSASDALPAPAIIETIAEEVAPTPQADEFDGLPF